MSAKKEVKRIADFIMSKCPEEIVEGGVSDTVNVIILKYLRLKRKVKGER